MDTSAAHAALVEAVAARHQEVAGETHDVPSAASGRREGVAGQLLGVHPATPSHHQVGAGGIGGARRADRRDRGPDRRVIEVRPIEPNGVLKRPAAAAPIATRRANLGTFRDRARKCNNPVLRGFLRFRG